MNHLRLAIIFTFACGSSASSGPDGTGTDASSADAADLACERSPAPADRDRFVVVSRPFYGSSQSPRYEVFRLDQAGELSTTGNTFEMSRAFTGQIAFTADGEVGVAAHDDGTLGVFTIDASGAVTVVETGKQFDFYASEVRASANGQRILVLDGEFRNIGGGVYSVAVGCDGQLTSEGIIAPSQLPADLIHLPGERAIVPADDILDSPQGSDLHLVDLSGATPRWISGVSLFGGADAIVSEAAVSHSGELVVVGDNCGFCGPNRIAVARMTGDSLELAQTISPFNDPYDVIASPFDDSMLVVSGFGNGMFELRPAAAGAVPYQAPVELAYVGARPQLPANPVQITRGSLTGLVLLPENVGVRRIQFNAGAPATDLGLFSPEDQVVGAIGVQP